MKILSIETSCDETAIAILDISGPLEKPDINILGNVLNSQVALHEQYGGVFPALAKREHEKNLPILLEKVLVDTRDKIQIPKDLDLIAVTSGPGLEPALWTGIVFAQELGEKYDLPVVGINHMEGHIWSVLYQNKNDNMTLPALALLVSGGHTEIVMIKAFGQYEILGRTLDDAVGEAFDKVARILGLAYPGGPKISLLADRSRARLPDLDFKFPRPMIHSKDLNFSFSGLKTAVLYKTQLDKRHDEEYKEDIARAFEEAAIDILLIKTRKALENSETNIKSLILGGGVAANKYLITKLREMIEEFPEITMHMPEKSLTTDNAVMIALAAYIHTSSNPSVLEDKNKIIAKGNLKLN